HLPQPSSPSTTTPSIYSYSGPTIIGSIGGDATRTEHAPPWTKLSPYSARHSAACRIRSDRASPNCDTSFHRPVRHLGTSRALGNNYPTAHETAYTAAPKA